MAILTFKRCKNLKRSVEYVTEERDDENLFTSWGTSQETAVEDFRNIKNNFHKAKGTPTLHLVQSWSPKESKMRTPEEFHAMGKRLVEDLFPGHQYCLRNHTDTGRVHNHIILNTVNA